MAETSPELQALIERGRAKGFLTYDEINDAMPEAVQTAADIDAWLEAIAGHGIEILEAPPPSAPTAPPPDGMLQRLVAGLETMHDDPLRRAFLQEIGGRLDEVARWIESADLSGQVEAHYTPTFLHGGSSTGRWIVMGINPGADDQVEEHEFKRGCPANYVDFHERFFFHFPTLRLNWPWWSKLYRVTRILDGQLAPAGKVPWPELERSSSFVVQDLLPFHGKSSDTLQPLETSVLGRIATATIEGVARSAARGVLVLNRHGYRLFEKHPRVRLSRRFSLDGKTSKGKARHIAGYIARIGGVPLVALDNEFVRQPTFPYEASLPALLAQLRLDGLAPA